MLHENLGAPWLVGQREDQRVSRDVSKTGSVFRCYLDSALSCPSMDDNLNLLPPRLERPFALPEFNPQTFGSNIATNVLTKVRSMSVS